MLWGNRGGEGITFILKNKPRIRIIIKDILFDIVFPFLQSKQHENILTVY